MSPSPIVLANVDGIAKRFAGSHTGKAPRRLGGGYPGDGRNIHVTLGRNRGVARRNTRFTSPVESCGRASEATPGATVGGKYTLLREAGMGGMGVVWVARNEVTGGEVALKFILPSAEWSPARLARLRREACATASLSHRGIVRVYDLVEAADGQLLLVLELLRGHTLAERIDHEDRLAPADAVRIALDLLSALAHVHGSGIVHRDIKPPNVFLAVDPDGCITTKLLDFGVSKTRYDGASLTSQGEVVGTPSYMSPEQALGTAVDLRSDIFAMGILLYEMLGGNNPFAGPDKPILSVVLLADHVPPLDGVPPALWAVVKRALRRDPQERFASAADMALALREAMTRRLVALPRRRARFVGALVALSLFSWLAITVAIAPPAASSATRSPPRAKAVRVVTQAQRQTAALAMLPIAAPPPARPAWTPPRVRLGFATDPGF
jgi:serine/threonine protein kinase